MRYAFGRREAGLLYPTISLEHFRLSRNRTACPRDRLADLWNTTNQGKVPVTQSCRPTPPDRVFSIWALESIRLKLKHNRSFEDNGGTHLA